MSRNVACEVRTPIKLRVEPTKDCNFTCRMCRSPAIARFAKLQKLFAPMPMGTFLRLEQVIRRSTYVYLNGWGEPYLNPSFEDMIELTRLWNPHAFVGFNSNFSMMNEERLSHLVRNKVNTVTVSVDSSLSKNYERIRRGGKFDSLVENLRLLNRLRNEYGSSYPELVFEFVVMKDNITEILDFVRFARAHGSKNVIFDLLEDPAVHYGRQLELCSALSVRVRAMRAKEAHYKRNLELYLHAKEVALEYGIVLSGSAVRKFQDLMKKQVTEKGDQTDWMCPEPFQTMYVGSDGEVFPCYWFERSLGRVGTNPPLEIFNNAEYRKLRSILLLGSRPAECRDCTRRTEPLL